MALKPLKPPVYIPLHDGWRLYAVAADTTTRRGALVTFELREGDDQVLRNTKTLCLADDAQTLLAADQFATLCNVAKADIHRDTMLGRWCLERAAVGTLLFQQRKPIAMEERAHDHPSDLPCAGEHDRGYLVRSL